MKVLVVTPTYNERKNIANLIEAISTVNPDYDILVVDDNSPDGTGDVVRSLQERYSNLFIETRPGKSGLGKAYIHGFTWALERDYDIIIQMDADMSHDPTEIPNMVDLLEENQLVIGSRYAKGVSVVHWPIRRLVLSYGANVYTRIVTGMPLKDATGGFKAWKREVLEVIDLQRVNAEGYSFQIEMNFRTWLKKFNIIEHPIIFIDRTIGESKMSRSIIYEAVLMVWRLRIWRIFGWNK